jgi:hypothetical protein
MHFPASFSEGLGCPSRHNSTRVTVVYAPRYTVGHRPAVCTVLSRYYDYDIAVYTVLYYYHDIAVYTVLYYFYDIPCGIY